MCVCVCVCVCYTDIYKMWWVNFRNFKLIYACVYQTSLCSVSSFVPSSCWTLLQQIPQIFVQVFLWATIAEGGIMLHILFRGLSCLTISVQWWFSNVCNGRHQAYPKLLLERLSCSNCASSKRYMLYHLDNLFVREIYGFCFEKTRKQCCLLHKVLLCQRSCRILIQESFSSSSLHLF